MQDWKPVVLNRRRTNNNEKKGTNEQRNAQAMRKGEQIESVKKGNAGKNTQKAQPNARKIEQMIDEGEGSMKVKTVDVEFSLKLQKARQSKNMTQKELAAKIAEKVTVINEYENGTAIPSGVIISKLEKALGVRLRGNN